MAARLESLVEADVLLTPSHDQLVGVVCLGSAGGVILSRWKAKLPAVEADHWLKGQGLRFIKVLNRDFDLSRGGRLDDKAGQELDYEPVAIWSILEQERKLRGVPNDQIDEELKRQIRLAGQGLIDPDLAIVSYPIYKIFAETYQGYFRRINQQMRFN